ncbi:conserved oligomeric Golgi complex subunit 8-like [Clytia hemisphaerica]|uniref:conserved oligomeric Golgi complex subunit 8-like n=1 Tax=Clytia hemisphaerica TaxID=252671 RepID=UPI0034D4AC7C
MIKSASKDLLYTGYTRSLCQTTKSPSTSLPTPPPTAAPPTAPTTTPPPPSTRLEDVLPSEIPIAIINITFPTIQNPNLLSTNRPSSNGNSFGQDKALPSLSGEAVNSQARNNGSVQNQNQPSEQNNPILNKSEEHNTPLSNFMKTPTDPNTALPKYNSLITQKLPQLKQNRTSSRLTNQEISQKELQPNESKPLASHQSSMQQKQEATLIGNQTQLQDTKVALKRPVTQTPIAPIGESIKDQSTANLVLSTGIMLYQHCTCLSDQQKQNDNLHPPIAFSSSSNQPDIQTKR